MTVAHGVLIRILLIALIFNPSAPSNITSLCEDVRKVFNIINGEFVTYNPPEHCKPLYGLGYSVLSKNNAPPNGCFMHLYDKICAIKLQERVFGPMCQSTLALFRRIVESGGVQLGENGEILDSKNFCDKSFVLVKGGSGDNVIDRPQRFESDKLDDCRAIVESYNICVFLTSSITKTSGKICLYKFEYCELSTRLEGKNSNLAPESDYTKYCKNVIAPMLLMDAIFVNGYKKNTCTDLSNYEIYLLEKKLQLDKSAKECLDTANSITAISRWENNEISDNGEMDNAQEGVNKIFNKLHVVGSKGLGFDSAVIDEFNKIAKLVKKGEELSMRFSQDLFRNIVIYRQIKHIFPIIATHVTSIKEFINRGHVSFANAYGFQPLTTDEIEELRARILQLFAKCRLYMNMNGESNSSDDNNSNVAMELRNKASELTRISGFFGEQISLVKKCKENQSDKEFTLPSALARLSKLAEA